IEDMAWANGLKTDQINSSKSELIRSKRVNPNLYTVSIEHAGHTGRLTEEQFKATVKLHKHIKEEVKKIYGVDIVLNRKNIIGHIEVDAIRKPNCPGKDFPWDKLMEELQKKEETKVSK